MLNPSKDKSVHQRDYFFLETINSDIAIVWCYNHIKYLLFSHSLIGYNRLEKYDLLSFSGPIIWDFISLLAGSHWSWLELFRPAAVKGVGTSSSLMTSPLGQSECGDALSWRLKRGGGTAAQVILTLPCHSAELSGTCQLQTLLCWTSVNFLCHLLFFLIR